MPGLTFLGSLLGSLPGSLHGSLRRSLLGILQRLGSLRCLLGSQLPNKALAYSCAVEIVRLQPAFVCAKVSSSKLTTALGCQLREHGQQATGPA